MNGNDRDAVVGAIVKSKDIRSLEDQGGEIIFLATGVISPRKAWR